MSPDEYAELMARSRRNLALDPYAPPIEQDRDEPGVTFRPVSFRRRANEPEPEPVRKPPDAMIARRLEALEARYERDKAGIRRCLEAITDEAAGACNKLAQQIKELQKQVAGLTTQVADQKTAIEEMRGQVALLRALQPQKLLRKGAPPTTIEGSLNASQNLN
jgi:hypothetical protein